MDVAPASSTVGLQDEEDTVPRPRWYPTPRRVEIGNPAAGANLSRLNDSGGIWLVRGVAFRLVTSAVVANRVVSLLATAGEDVWFRTSAGGVQAASVTVDYCAFPGSGAPAGTSPVSLLGWPTDGLVLPPGHVLASSVALIDVGDQLSAVFLDVIEYPEALPTHLVPMPVTFSENDQE